jgi:hypothetical protein
MAVLLHTSPPFVHSSFFGNDLETRGAGNKSHFYPGEEPLYAHECEGRNERTAKP